MTESVEHPHAKTAEQVLFETRSSKDGLTSREADRRLSAIGPNRLPGAPPPRILKVFFRQFLNPLIYILLFVGAVSVLLGHVSDAVFVLGVLLLNALIGTAQEYGAEKSAFSLREMSASKSIVLRDGENLEIDAVGVVTGDVVRLESGMKVPADLRLLSAHGLEVNESLLTGESLPVQKDSAPQLAEEAVLGDRRNMAYAGTLVGRGRGMGVVTSTGIRTELGRIAVDVLERPSTKTPLIIRMEAFTKKLSFFFLLAILAIGAVLLLRGQDFTEVLLLTVALGVAAVPEGLPVALTVALAIASKRMAKRNVIVRALSSVEALGSCTFIATDKTGTLTINELTVSAVAPPALPEIAVSGSGIVPEGEMRIPPSLPTDETKAWLEEFAEACVLCNEAVLAKRDGAWSAAGDAVDIALLVMAHKAGVTAAKMEKSHALISRIPYEPELKLAASLHERDGEPIVCAKGAVEEILALCDRMAGPRGSASPMEQVKTQADELAGRGYRVLAVAAGRPRTPVHGPLQLSHLTNLRLLGLACMIDPLRPESKDAIHASRRAGVEVAMVTGDHPLTAQAIGRELGLTASADEIVTGRDLGSARSESEFDRMVGAARVFARVNPQQKLKIVHSLIRQGHFVAVTGDGANDAPALKAAHVGVAMGKSGTDVAKETSDLILADDRFSSVIAGIEEGRVAYANVRKVVYLLVATGIGEIFLILFSLIAGMPLPLTAIQLLWLNLVTEGIQGIALAFESKEGDELEKPPRPPDEAIFDRLMIERVALSALVMGGVGFIVYRHLGSAGMDFALVQNHVLLLMVLFENVMIGNARSETKSGFALSPWRNPLLLLGAVTAQGVHILAMQVPAIGGFLGASPVSFADWLKYLVLATSIFFVLEIHKWWMRARTRKE